jgi:acetate kinase
MNVLVINCGSSSIKYQLYDVRTEQALAGGLIERIGEAAGHTEHRCGTETFERDDPIPDYRAGIGQIIELLTTCGDPPPIASPADIAGAGHRVVHGGESFADSVRVDEKVLAAIDACASLAPLHNPANLAGIRATMEVLDDKPQVAVFDTAFFQTMPPSAYHYAVPHAWYEQHRVRRYGFHGTSHKYVAGRAAGLLDKPKPNLITLHLGNGCSMACIRAGAAIDQTMGLTPLEGLVMGTRSGDLDPAIVFHMIGQGLEVAEVRRALEKESGLLGISGVSRDLRDVMAAADEGHARAGLAIEVFAHRAKKYVGAFLAELGACDAIVFTGGIGENSAAMRRHIVGGLDPLGIELDESANEKRAQEPVRISRDTSRTAIWVIPTNEELMIARDTVRLIG